VGMNSLLYLVQQPPTGQTPTSSRHSPRPSGDAVSGLKINDKAISCK
jgi:hypothetical protein